MNNLKKALRNQFQTFSFFYGYLGNKIIIAFVVCLLVSILDGLGLSMFLPLLQVVDNGGEVDPAGMGKLRFLIDAMESMGVDLSVGFVLLFMLIFFLFKGVTFYMSLVYFAIMQESFVRGIRIKLLSALNEMDFKSFITSDAGRIQNTMSGEVDSVSRAFNSYFGIIQQGAMVGVYMVFAFFVDIQFAVLVTIGGAVTNFLYKFIYNRTKKASIKLTASNSSYQGLLIQHVGNFKYLKATGRVGEYGRRLTNQIKDIEKSRKRIGLLSSIGQAAREPLLVAVIACVILIQTHLFGAAMGTILISLLFFYRALTALVSMQVHKNAFMAVSGSLENMQDFQRQISSSKEKDGHIVFDSFRDSIKISHLNFYYGQSKILDNINLEILKNQTVAFVGESGSGKTTLVNIIAGLLTDDKNNLRIDGIPIGEIKRESYQRRIGYITQDPVVFNDTLFNNVTFWAERTPENVSKFQYVISQASLDELLNSLPYGMDTLLGNNGINLSGGQKQRVSIARELYKDIDILIMDEATSALDSETELAIQQSIDALQGKYTILIVAHRLSTIRNVDRIIYMNKGQIESEGCFAELVDKHPRFKKIVSLQAI